MVKLSCRWRNVWMCACAPCVLLSVCTAVFICLSLTAAPPSSSPSAHKRSSSSNHLHFVAPGAFRNNGLAPVPQSFWADALKGPGLWNRLQQATERHYNPILRPNLRRMNSSSDARLRQSFSELAQTGEGLRERRQLLRPMRDFVSHMQRRDYPVLIQPRGACGAGAAREERPPLLLLAIKSSEINLRNRQAIRRTWGQVGWVAAAAQNLSTGHRAGAYVRRVFLIAKEDPEELEVDLSHVLQRESRLYGDILQWDFTDTFFNLTLKDVLFWTWFSGACGRTRFVFKGDDDVFVNTGNLLTYLRGQLAAPEARKRMKDFMVGHVIEGAQPAGDPSSKYFISDRFYKGFYPAYATGGGVVYSGLLARRLRAVSPRVQLFPIDDVYVGMCMVRLNLSPAHHPAFLAFDVPAEERKQPCLYHRLLLVHQRQADQIINLWEELQRTRAQCGDVPLRGQAERQQGH